MSNRIALQATEFINHPQGTKTYGYRAYDDYGQAYNNNFETIIDDDFELLKEMIKDDSDIVRAMLEFMVDNQHGIYIGDTWYDWKEIKHIVL